MVLSVCRFSCSHDESLNWITQPRMVYTWLGLKGLCRWGIQYGAEESVYLAVGVRSIVEPFVHHKFCLGVGGKSKFVTFSIQRCFSPPLASAVWENTEQLGEIFSEIVFACGWNRHIASSKLLIKRSLRINWAEQRQSCYAAFADVKR